MRFPVSEKKQKELEEKMTLLGIRESDLEEKFIRSSGPGGQNVNKVSTGVYLKHIPTGIEVKWTSERSQGLNRFLARRELVRKIMKIKGMKTAKTEDYRRIRRQKAKKRKRSMMKYHSEPA